MLQMHLLLCRAAPCEEVAALQKRSRSRDPGHEASGFSEDNAAAKKRQKICEPELPPPPPAAPAEVQTLRAWRSAAALTSLRVREKLQDKILSPRRLGHNALTSA